jgi:hypothetical protein
MKSIFNIGADLAHTLALNKGFNLPEPSIIKANEEAGFRLQETHKVRGYFFIRKQSFGLVLTSVEDPTLFELLNAKLPTFKFKGYEAIARSYKIMNQILVTDICESPGYKELKAQYITADSYDHNKWANIIGLRLFEDFIEQMLPLIETWARQQGRI